MQQQTVSSNQQQPVMMKPPSEITTKDYAYLKDQLSWLLLAMKKCAHYANECSDPQIGQAINQVGQAHLRHYNLLLAHFQTNSTMNIATAPQPAQNH